MSADAAPETPRVIISITSEPADKSACVHVNLWVICSVRVVVESNLCLVVEPQVKPLGTWKDHRK